MFNRRFLVLFYARLLIYLVAVGIPLFHPAVVVSYDSMIRWLWFLLVPAQMHLAFFLSPPRIDWKIWLGSFVVVAVGSVLIFTGIGGPVGLFVIAQALAFITTALVFNGGNSFRPFVFAEVPLLVWLLVKLLEII